MPADRSSSIYCYRLYHGATFLGNINEVYSASAFIFIFGCRVELTQNLLTVASGAESPDRCASCLNVHRFESGLTVLSSKNSAGKMEEMFKKISEGVTKDMTEEVMEKFRHDPELFQKAVSSFIARYTGQLHLS